MEASVSRNWSDLPLDLINLILEEVEPELEEFIRFTWICKSWRSTALTSSSLRHQQSRVKFHLLKCANALPMLMSPIEDSENENDHSEVNLFSVTESDKQVYRLQISIECIIKSSTRFICNSQGVVFNCATRSWTPRFIGSSKGWLFIMDNIGIVTQINPFLNKTVELPKLKFSFINVIRLTITKVFLFSDREQKNHCLLPLITPNGKLAWLKPDAKAWRFITFNEKQFMSFSDIGYFNGEIYGVDRYGCLLRIDLIKQSCTIVVERFKFDDSSCRADAVRAYLVESREDGNLLLVKQYNSHIENEETKAYYRAEFKVQDYRTDCFKVYKLLNHAWVRIKSIGEQALFLGRTNDSISVSTRDFPNCKPNTIYYLERYPDLKDSFMPQGFDDSGVYSMEDDGSSFTKNHSLNFPSSPSIWVVPTFKS